MRVVGVDGCPGGWVAVVWDDGLGTLPARAHASFADLLAAHDEAAAIGIDIPIGLAEGRPRRCDVEARRVLGARRSSVFPAPDPRLLATSTYHAATALSRELLGKGISRQAFAIYPKVAEVNAAMTPELQRRVVEVHPEVSFTALASRPMAYPKRTPEGFAERRAYLQAAFPGVDIPDRDAARQVARPASPDDVLDAIVAAWTAKRFATERACRLPEVPDTDARGLRMEIVY